MTTTFRNAIFQLHWFFGITAGLVLALVGVTGGILSFEDEILEALNPGVMTVEAAGRPALSPSALLSRVGAARPGEQVASLELSSDPGDAAMVGFAAKDGGRRGERRHVDPYSGQVLAEPRHQEFFRTTMQLHRWLAADDVGKQIVGASTVILIFFCVSGLYLRWPRRWRSLRTWLALDWKQKGRNFLWHLHSVVGTWVLVAYLVMSLTGLWWSYDWYRDAVNAWADAGTPAEAEVALPADRGTPPPLDVDAAWQAFSATAPAWSTATLNLPKGDGADDAALSFRYLDADPAHERARNSLSLDRWTLAPLAHERYEDGSLRQKIGGSMFALHRGSFFGTPGVVVFMLASLLMPLFAVTGWMLYLDRRRKRRAARALAGAALPGQAPGPATHVAAPIDRPDAPVLVAFASQTGTAERLAWQTATSLRQAGVEARVESLARLQAEDIARGRTLFVVSTFGEGEPPDEARAFARRMQQAQPPLLAGAQYAVLALGDRDYDDSFCGFGRDLDQWLRHAGARPLFDRVDVDGHDPGALRHWQHHVGLLAGRTDLPDWDVPRYRPWKLVAREHLNPGSPGGPTFLVALEREAAGAVDWEAGDVAEIGPRNADAVVSAWLQDAGLDGEALVDRDGARTSLRDLLARSRLPVPASPERDGQAGAVNPAPPAAAQGVADALEPLPHREYSIASLPQDGRLELLVRQMRHPDGSLGSGSGWLTEHAGVGSTIDVRLRANPGFRAPEADRPLVLIGNGTGLAGLRAVLKARAAQGRHRNWLLFGERSQAHDLYFGDELDGWLASGQLQRLDLVFSRDRPDQPYVQDLLAARSDELKRWLDAGAAVYVCGSLAGMAPGVDAVLREVAGAAALEAMAGDGRYRRDVY